VVEVMMMMMMMMMVVVVVVVVVVGIMLIMASWASMLTAYVNMGVGQLQQRGELAKE
jgi:uncharacterized protein YqfA (UPF0365 family)